MNQARQILLLVGKDLRIEARSRQTIGLVIVLGILIVVVLALGLGPGPGAKGASATAILWVAYLFGGVLCFEKTMAVERHDDALAGLLLAPKSGAELRREARDSASRARGAVADKYGTAKQAVTDVVDRGRRALNVGRETYNEARTSHRVTG
jgi:hypothetical protein